MNNIQRTIAVLNYQNYDRLPLVHFGFWDETLAKWVAEGYLPKEGAWNAAGPALGFDFTWEQTIIPNYFLDPPFARAVVKQFPDGSRHVRSPNGVTILEVPGVTSIAQEIEHLLVDRASWETHYRPRLQWSEKRLSNNWAEWAAQQKIRFQQQDMPHALHCGSLLGMIRDLVGVVGLAYLIADDEELLDEIIQTVADISFRNVQGILASGVHCDCAQFWEDICFKNGPLINPRMFHQKFAPHYKRITNELNKAGINIVAVDCDGLIDSLIPTWVENGVNTMFPIEVGTWNASIRPWREIYGREIRGVGGMNKNVFAVNREAVDAEIERLKPLVALGGYLPCPDHRIPPHAKWDLVRYYCDRMHEVYG